MEKQLLSVPAIHCNHCVHTIEMELGELEGVRHVKADAKDKTVAVEYEAPATLETITGKLAEINYPVE